VRRFATNFTECDLDDYDLPAGAGSRGKGGQQPHAPDSAATASLIGALGVGIGAAGGVDGAPMTRERFAAALQRAARDPLVIEKAFTQYLAFVTDGGVNDDAADVAEAEGSPAGVNGSTEQSSQGAGDAFGIPGGPLIPDTAAATVAPAAVAAPLSSGPSPDPIDALEQLRKFQEQQNAATPAPAPAPAVPLDNQPKMDALEQLRAFQQGPPPSLGGADGSSAGGARGGVGGLAALGLGGALGSPLGQSQPPQQPHSGQNLVDKLAAMMQQQQQPPG
jgi:F0F1-type ATP synthase membrane subunit c/vacuolar-type H+-ATPase subunit K